MTEEPQAEAEAAACSANSASNPPKVKSADTNVRVSLKIVNEVEGVENEKLDIVDEELANMAVAESLNDIPAAAIDMDNAVEVEDFEDNTEDTAGEEGDDEEDEDEDRDDAVVVNLPINGKNPGTPISNSERSSQTSATSSNSTKQLLPKSRLEGGRVERSSAESEEKNTTPVQSESKIVMVVPQNDDDDDDEEATGIPATNEEFCWLFGIENSTTVILETAIWRRCYNIMYAAALALLQDLFSMESWRLRFQPFIIVFTQISLLAWKSIYRSENAYVIHTLLADNSISQAHREKIYFFRVTNSREK